MITIPFQHCVITASPDLITNVFSDGVVRHFYLSGVADDPEYHRIARWAGYGDDWHRYAVEHDAAHALVAEFMGLKWCPVLHDPLPVPLDDAPQQHKDIEHLANAVQRWYRLRAPDPYVCLERLFGAALDRQTGRFGEICEQAWAIA